MYRTLFHITFMVISVAAVVLMVLLISIHPATEHKIILVCVIAAIIHEAYQQHRDWKNERKDISRKI
jgi:hypothetical protein